MKLEIYNTDNMFKLKDSLEITPEHFEKFYNLIHSLAWGGYSRQHHQSYIVDKEKAINLKLDNVAISRITDNVEIKDFFDVLLTANGTQDINDFLEYYIQMER